MNVHSKIKETDQAAQMLTMIYLQDCTCLQHLFSL